MGNKKKTFVNLIIIFMTSLALANDKVDEHKKPEYHQAFPRAKELLKKFGLIIEPKEVLEWRNTLAKDERIDLDNEYFRISYPKCFKVEPTVEGEEGINIKNSASLVFTRTDKCKPSTIKSADSFTFAYDSKTKKTDLKGSGSEITIYKQYIDIHGLQGAVHWSLDDSYENKDVGYMPYTRWSIDILCKGKKENSIFQAIATYPEGDDVAPFLEKKSFDIPEDFKQIIGSFQCPKK
ncbi:MAG: hypothetical protein ACOYOK_01920 [Pseudobdellovibrionaceae bacterium]